jgi:histidine triad (HIT) family protein
MFLKDGCIFCNIVNGNVPVDLVKETDNFIVIKDINPVAPVHLLIISKNHYDSVLDIDGGGGRGEGKKPLLRQGSNDGNQGGNELFGLLGALASEFNVKDKGFRTVINTKDDGGQTVSHLHIHFMAGRRFGWPPG